MEQKRWNEPTPMTRPSRITIPEHAHPVAKFAFRQMSEQRISYREMEACSGVLTCTLKATRNENTPGLNTMDAVLGVLGFTLIPVPLPNRLPPALREDLEALADKHGVDGDLCTELIAACVGRYPWTAKAWQEHKRSGELDLTRTSTTSRCMSYGNDGKHVSRLPH
ncbi:MAG TPA: hypothetical protein VM620_09770 [Hyphomicrobium sp.]|nr:hypothetical protein [Hyphomicrobium sp.]